MPQLPGLAGSGSRHCRQPGTHILPSHQVYSAGYLPSAGRGAALSPRDCVDAEALLMNAVVALYHCKANRNGNDQLYDPMNGDTPFPGPGFKRTPHIIIAPRHSPAQSLPGNLPTIGKQNRPVRGAKFLLISTKRKIFLQFVCNVTYSMFYLGEIIPKYKFKEIYYFILLFTKQFQGYILNTKAERNPLREKSDPAQAGFWEEDQTHEKNP